MVASFDVGSQTLTNATNWKNTYGLTHPVGYDQGYVAWGMYGEGYVPHNVLIGQDMTVLYSESGYDESVLISIIEAELNKAPTKPTNFHIVNETNSTISLAWDHNPESDVEGYRLNYTIYTKGPRVFKATVDVGYVNAYTLTGLQSNSIYELTLEAYDQREAQPAVPTEPLYAETQGTCANNPTVNVTPNGPFHVCVDTDIVLTANTSGGTGPFSYQWLEDTNEIPGATNATYTASSTGTHLYNCSVSGSGCSDDNHDVQRVVITWQVVPDFEGIMSVTDGTEQTCTIDLAWSPASSVCPGPFLYSIYRDTTSPVSLIPANLIASGITATTYSDAFNLEYGQTYYYVVHVTDQVTGGEDDNTIELSGSPHGPGSGDITFYEFDFQNVTEWNRWVVTTGPGQHTCGAWARVNTDNQRPPNSTGYYALSDSDACGSGSWTSTIVTSPRINCSADNLATVTLECDLFYRRYNGGDAATVEVFNGSSWQTIWTNPADSVEEHFAWDVTSQLAGVGMAKIRFSYQNANYDYWFSVDNVSLTGYISMPCETGNDVPALSPLALIGLVALLSVMLIMFIKRGRRFGFKN
ncbi:fibronectin type III domain-containing protein [bacterium]|nr:fibronectin type III domain-containing protein [bacterium]